MTATAYRLVWDTEQCSRHDDDASLVLFDGWEEVLGWQGTAPVTVPDQVLFEANFDVTRDSDFPCNDRNWPLMSPRMLEILCGVGNFPHRRYPVRLIDRSVPVEERYLSNGIFKPEVIDDRFVAVQLLDHLDIVNWDDSLFQRTTIGSFEAVSFEKLVLLEPSGGLPPLFRISADTSHRIASAEARSALEAADIRGIAFEPLPGMGPPPRRD